MIIEQGFLLKQPQGSNPQWSGSTVPSNPSLSGQLDSMHLSNGTASIADQLTPLSPTPLPTNGPPGVVRAVGVNSLPPTSPLPPNASLTIQPNSTIPATPVQQVLHSPADRYGLLGLLNIIKSSDPDMSMLALGSDLTSLGLDLGATELVRILYNH